jgi:hypothetical protein
MRRSKAGKIHGRETLGKEMKSSVTPHESPQGRFKAPRGP